MAKACPQGREVFVGPRGGHYYLTASGGKVYCSPPVVIPPAPTPTETYLGSIEIPDESVIPRSGLMSELNQMYLECFHQRVEHLTFLTPSSLFVMATDAEYHHLIASAVVSYERPEKFYIFNVCTRPAYRGKGYMRTLLTTLVERMREKHPTYPFYLEVEPTNSPAKKLYESFGFAKIKDTHHGRKVYDLMELK